MVLGRFRPSYPGSGLCACAHRFHTASRFKAKPLAIQTGVGPGFGSFGDWLVEAHWRQYRNQYGPVPGWGLDFRLGFVWVRFGLRLFGAAAKWRQRPERHHDETRSTKQKSSPPDPGELGIFIRRVDLLFPGWQAGLGDHFGIGAQMEIPQFQVLDWPSANHSTYTWRIPCLSNETFRFGSLVAKRP